MGDNYSVCHHIPADPRGGAPCVHAPLPAHLKISGGKDSANAFGTLHVSSAPFPRASSTDRVPLSVVASMADRHTYNVKIFYSKDS